ncbi:Twinkle protein, mitochondrial [Balamuthia mandrillaris]
MWKGRGATTTLLSGSVQRYRPELALFPSGGVRSLPLRRYSPPSASRAPSPPFIYLRQRKKPSSVLPIFSFPLHPSSSSLTRTKTTRLLSLPSNNNQPPLPLFSSRRGVKSKTSSSTSAAAAKEKKKSKKPSSSSSSTSSTASPPTSSLKRTKVSATASTPPLPSAKQPPKEPQASEEEEEEDERHADDSPNEVHEEEPNLDEATKEEEEEDRQHQRQAQQPIAAGTTFVSSHFQIAEGDVLAFLARMRVVHRLTGEEIIVRECPCCPDHKNKPDNLFKLYISRSTGAFFCHRCGKKGSWFDFKKLLGGGGEVVAPTAREDSIAITAPTPSKPILPVQTTVNKYTTGLMEGQFPKVMQMLTGKKDPSHRHLSLDVIKKYKVGATNFNFYDPVSNTWKEHTCVTFPWIDAHPSKGGRSVVQRVKLRAIDNKSLQRLEPKGGVWGLFGWHTIKPTDTEVVLTEGEYDAMAVHQATGMPAISLPNGAQSLPIELLPQLERFSKIYLWMDDDVPGQDGAHKFAQKLGLKRCYLVSTKDGDPDGPKDANDALRQGKNLSALLAKAKRIPHNKIFVFEDLKDEIHRMIGNAAQIRGKKSNDFPSFNTMLKGHRKGELTIFTGHTGIGKTTFLSQLSLDFAAQGVPTLWGSFEIKNTILLKKMLQQYTQAPLESLIESKDKWEEHTRKFSELPLYFLKFYGSTSVEQVLDAMEYAVYVYDVEHIVLDNLQFMLSGAGSSNNPNHFGKFDHQDRALEEFRRFATDKNVHITLVVHPRKQDDGVPLTNASVFGSVKATQEADNVVMLQKGKDWKYLDIRKNRFDGQTGSFPLRFHKDTCRFTELVLDEPPQEETTEAATKPGTSTHPKTSFGGTKNGRTKEFVYEYKSDHAFVSANEGDEEGLREE